jgi:hypothetical protein
MTSGLLPPPPRQRPGACLFIRVKYRLKDGYRFVANIRGDARNAVGGELYPLVCQ